MLKIIKIAYKTPNNQHGTTVVEFALFAVLFFVLLFGILEFGRLFYLYNTVQEVTRHAARSAVVSLTTSKSDIQKTAVFSAVSSGSPVGLPAGGEVTNLMVSITYLHGRWLDPSSADSEWKYDELDVTSFDPANNIKECVVNSDLCINFVEAKVCKMTGSVCVPVKYVPMVGFFPFLAVPIPASTVIMPAESMGYSG